MTADFVAKLRALDLKNSQNELSIEKFLTKSEEAFFDKVKEDKRENAASLRSQRDSFYHLNTSRSSFYLTAPDCRCPFLSTISLAQISFQLLRLVMRWVYLVAEESMEVRRLSSRLGCRSSCPGKPSVGRCMVSSWRLHRSVLVVRSVLW